MKGTYEVGMHKTREKVNRIQFCVITFFRKEIIFYSPLFSYKSSVRFSTLRILKVIMLFTRDCVGGVRFAQEM